VVSSRFLVASFAAIIARWLSWCILDRCAAPGDESSRGGYLTADAL